MNIFLVISSILAVTGLVWILSRFLSYKVCAICAGVSGTWMLMLGARFLGYPIDPAVLAMLLGGSVVGVAYQLEKKLPQKRSALLWKVLFIPAGFVAAYGIVQSLWFMFLGALVLLLLFSYSFLRAPREHTNFSPTKELEEKMKQCC